ncbi:polycystin-1-like protein 2 [Ptychodera flava]|uniref:polycystin-1-like protein 2 n=1 Tax=Ptychodera flava TaxID=63121 RepID=UPI00396A04E9
MHRGIMMTHVAQTLLFVCHNFSPLLKHWAKTQMCPGEAYRSLVKKTQNLGRIQRPIIFITLTTMATRRRRYTLFTQSLLWILSLCYVQTGQSQELTLCVHEDNFRRNGLDMGDVPIYNSSVEDCCRICLETYGCVAWDYNKIYDQCWRKYAVPTKSVDNTVVSGVIEDTEKPAVICPPNIATNTYIDTPTIQVTWALPNASDNSGTIRLSGSHTSGSNFTIGVTTVEYEAEDSCGNSATCRFDVTVKALARPFFDDSNGKKTNVSVSQIVDKFIRTFDATKELINVNVSAEESKILAQDILQSMDEAIEVISNMPAENGQNNGDVDLLTKSLLKTTDDLATFVLRNTEPGSGPVVLETPSILLNLDSDSIQELTNTSIDMGDGHGFSIPPVDTLFSNWTSQQPIGRIIKRLVRRSFPHGDKANEYDILSMSLTDAELNEIKVNGTKEDIAIIFACDSQAQETLVLLEGVYLKLDDVTHFRFQVNITHLFHAVIIHLESSHPMSGNATAYIFDDVVEYSSNYSGYRFSVDVQFGDGDSSIFIPEHVVFVTGGYYLTFTLPSKQDLNFAVSIKHVTCSYQNEESGTWKNDGCKVSPASNMTSTVCLCNHLTTFTTSIEME